MNIEKLMGFECSDKRFFVTIRNQIEMNSHNIIVRQFIDIIRSMGDFDVRVNCANKGRVITFFFMFHVFICKIFTDFK